MAGAKSCSTPIALKPPPDDGVLCSSADATLFRSLVGALHYLTFTRPDIAFSVSKISQYLHRPTQTHLVAAKRILRYLLQNPSAGLLFRRCSSDFFKLNAFSDSDWAGDSADRRSTTGFVLFLGANPISWTAKKQSTVSRSSTEAEYRALAATAAELFWVRQLLRDRRVYSSKPPSIWCDNSSAIQLA